tara:strand:- start:579 stop:758 length:180 start_codon:yes stop_codon:yes gene_type:complete
MQIETMRTKEETLADGYISFWLRDAINSVERRDILDALNDAETLLALIKADAAKLGINV